MLKIIMTLITLWFLNSCGSSSSYYVLSPAPQPKSIYSYKNRIIAVEKVTVPEYLYKRDIAVAKTATQISLLNGAVWGEDLDTGLTNRLISFMQKKFQQPSVYAYPWGLDRQPNIKLNVDVTRFIAQGSSVYLDANWEVVDMATKRRKTGLFHTQVLTANDADSIVTAMDKAFGELEEVVSKGLKTYY